MIDMFAGRVKKAWAAFLTAFIGAAAMGLATEIPQTKTGWLALASGAATVGLVAAGAVFKTKNTGAGVDANGSDKAGAVRPRGTGGY